MEFGMRRQNALVVMVLAGLLATWTGCDRGTAEKQAPPTATVAATAGDAAATQPAPSTSGAVAYYFHRTLRCKTCLAIESLAKEALEAAFADALKDGRLVWRPTDIEQPGNEHFAEDFALTTSSLVIASYRDGELVEWELLPEVWELVDDPLRFQEYVWMAVQPFVPAAESSS
jgi:hypothetical protein